MRMASDDDQVTPRGLYMNRRTLMRGGLLAATAVGTGWLYRKLNDPSSGGAQTAKLDGLLAAPSGPASGFGVMGEAQTDFESATHYNNFYEFSDRQGRTWRRTAAASSRPGGSWPSTGWCRTRTRSTWTTWRQVSPPQERVYRMRCVEAWSMVVPWAGFSLAKLLDAVQPMPGAKYVAFTTLLDPRACRGRRPTCCSGRTSRGCGSTRRCTR